MSLVVHKSEVLAEGEDEILHVMDDSVLHRPLIHILLVTDAQFFHIDVVQQVFIFECIDGTESLLCRRKRPREVVRQTALVVIIVAAILAYSASRLSFSAAA